MGLNVTITGVALVFAMLVLLVAILILFGKISVALQNAKNKKIEKARKAMFDALSSNDEETEPTVATVISREDGLSEEVVAVISAAVATMYMNSPVKPVIKAIKKSAGRRSAWANAGVIDNTRAF